MCSSKYGNNNDGFKVVKTKIWEEIFVRIEFKQARIIFALGLLSIMMFITWNFINAFNIGYDVVVNETFKYETVEDVVAYEVDDKVEDEELEGK